MLSEGLWRGGLKNTRGHGELGNPHPRALKEYKVGTKIFRNE